MTALMDNESREMLERRLEENRQRLAALRLEREKARIAESVEGFAAKYRFADEDELKRIEAAISSIGLAYPFCHAFEKESQPVPHGEMYLCFLLGSTETFCCAVCGRYQDIIADMESWEMLSPYILLLDKEQRGYILIGGGKRLESPMG